jgi:hypothetical protein
MGYTTGAKTLPAIIDEIAAGLIASTDLIDGLSKWSDADTSWNTTIKTALNARRTLKYTNDTEVMYVSLESNNTWYTSYGGHAAKGLRITFSSQWDSINHTYIGSLQQTSIPFEDYSGIAQPITDLATEILTYNLWTESNGFVIMAKPEPTGANLQMSFIAVVERNTNKLYTDNQSNFYCYNVNNIYPTFTAWSWQPSESLLHRSLLRPFVYKWPTGENISAQSPNYYCLTLGNFDRSYAFKSAGNGKVYYTKPVIFNDALATTQVNFPPSPIFQADLWFYWSEGMGLIDGDVVAIEGQTTKYLIKAVDSPDSAVRLTYAIKFVA